jgi:hypothetical protein
MKIKEEPQEPEIIKKKKSLSKNIGNSWERQFCKILSRWVSPNTNELMFWRSASSGAVATNRFKKKLLSKNMEGDITCLNFEYSKLTEKIYFECKTVKSNEFAFWSSPKSNYLYSAIIDTYKVASLHNKLLFLAVKIRNGKTPRLIILPKDYALKLKLPYNYSIWELPNKEHSFVILRMDAFFQHNTWQEVLKPFTDISNTN